MNLVEEVMEYEVRGLERFLTLSEYKNNIFGSERLESFERIIEKFNSSAVEVEIDREMRKIQLLIFKIESENNSLGLMNFILGKTKQFLNNYLVAYIILKRLGQEHNLFLPITSKEEEDTKMSNAINLVRNTELEFKHVKEFITDLSI
ncbi:MAG: hypothetical protein ABRQ37_17665, partial [Candidatus Eremiobacterota bacterium]